MIPERNDWFTLPSWPDWLKMRDHPNWQEKHPHGPVHFDIMAWGKITYEEIPPSQVDQAMKTIFA
jgi:hypothetical protein